LIFPLSSLPGRQPPASSPRRSCSPLLTPAADALSPAAPAPGSACAAPARRRPPQSGQVRAAPSRPLLLVVGAPAPDLTPRHHPGSCARSPRRLRRPSPPGRTGGRRPRQRAQLIPRGTSHGSHPRHAPWPPGPRPPPFTPLTSRRRPSPSSASLCRHYSRPPPLVPVSRRSPAVKRCRPQLPTAPPDPIPVAARALLDGRSLATPPRCSCNRATPTSVVSPSRFHGVPPPYMSFTSLAALVTVRALLHNGQLIRGMFVSFDPAWNPILRDCVELHPQAGRHVPGPLVFPRVVIASLAVEPVSSPPLPRASIGAPSLALSAHTVPSPPPPPPSPNRLGGRLWRLLPHYSYC
jgi:small nuclear ribonucleoprotein (snRNP)-like protein